MIRSLLVANRGEIAVRIARTCREMGVRSILAFAEDERHAFPRRFFDEGASLGPGEAGETYLGVGKIIDAAKRSGADAVHPGYGFLSERAELAAACEEAGLVFVGPPAGAIEAMGSKAGARTLMERLGVPVVPGYHGEEQSDARLAAEADRIGFPLLVKASAGGGGKGMKVAFGRRDLAEALASARREALRAFGDDRLLLEKLVEQPRHVEFQIFGDARGEIVHLFERDCSIQRRHQKVIEETPAPRFTDDLRARMGESALAAARGIGYRNAGTVEFILDPGGAYYFLEMNTRLQVEHPVTEMVLGVDLVRAQIETAGGAPLPWERGALRQRGHAIEARIYAEDPDQGFLPQTGTLSRFDLPAGPGVRVDSGVGEGSEVTVRYDPMLAKVIAWGETRETSIDRLVRALEETVVFGVTTNASYLRRVVRHPQFRQGRVGTHFLTAHERDLHPPDPIEAAAVAAVLSAEARGARSASPDEGAVVPSVWDLAGGWGRG
ncbi:MAG TPA: biotin carboxylase N-terminal domain-containing protein [Thermoanaerobaculia bacterium]|nr:biotin carboxylase N-terminal domain-containing protein [Thermoanaerobaculia bacterium]